MTHVADTGTLELLGKAVHQSKGYTRGGMLERIFTLAFSGLVYPQIWEDPEVDMEALALGQASRLVAITSGGCNVLSYLVANPSQIVAVDLNAAHVALARLKLTALRRLPDYNSFFRFVGRADDPSNMEAYRDFLQSHLDADTKRYWDGRDLLLRRRVSLFARNLYRHGLFGRFIGFCHWIARLHGVDPAKLIEARTIEEQRSFFDNEMAPLFDRPFIKWALTKSPTLFGLGIPPAQFDSLAAAGGGDIRAVLKERLRRLACAFPLAENYFAWQGFGRSYGTNADAPLPPYLQRWHFDALRDRADRVSIVQRSVTDQLKAERDESVDGYVLLDAQDWMTDVQLNDLWHQITRTAREGARVVFRTAARPSLLPGRVQREILDRWSYDSDASRRLGAKDRSATYGGLHLYIFRG